VRISAAAASPSRTPAVQEAALRSAQGIAGPETQELAAKLAKMTGCGIAKLAVHVEQWRGA
jgi:hypothetical protein